jgi:hypothetical protein
MKTGDRFRLPAATNVAARICWWMPPSIPPVKIILLKAILAELFSIRD